MSFQAINWAYQLDIDSGAKFTLVTLCNYADEDGTCFPKHETLAKMTGQSRRTIIRHIAELLNLGLIKVEYQRRDDGRQAASKYRVTFCHAGKSQSDISARQSDTMSIQSDTMSPARVTPCHTNNHQPEPPIEPSKEPSSARADPLPVRKAFDNYNIAAEELGLPQAQTLSDDRRRKLAARLREHGIEGWNRALLELEESEFCLGKNKNGWRADLDFLLQPKSFNRLLEGSYRTENVA